MVDEAAVLRARESTPPEGVLLDHLRSAISTETGPQRTIADFQKDEDDHPPPVGWLFPIPTEYIAFILNHNGIRFKTGVHFSCGGLRESAMPLTIKEFNCVRSNLDSINTSSNAESYTDPFNPGSSLIEVALATGKDPSAWRVYLGTTESSKGCVFVYELPEDEAEMHGDPPQDSLRQISDSFPTFLASLSVASNP